MATIGRTLFRLAGAVLLGASAASIDNPGILNDVGVSAHARVATVPVVVAAKDLPEGAMIDRTAVVVAQWPAGTQPAAAFSTVESVAGRVMSVAVFKGEAIVLGRLAPDATPPGLEVRITPGKRAFALRINDAAGIAGMVQPNSRVDIMVVINDREQGNQVAKLFMQNMRVLAIGRVVQRADDARPINSLVATIEVTPDEAERLAIAQNQGQIQLALRGYGDPDKVNSVGVTAKGVLRSLERSSTPPVRPAERSRTATVAESPLCGVHVRPDVIVRYLLRVDCGTTGELRFAKDSAARADSLQKLP